MQARRSSDRTGGYRRESAFRNHFLDGASALAIALLAGLVPVFGGCTAPDTTRADDVLAVRTLAGVRTWAIQLQGLETAAARRALETASVDMLVIEPMRSQQSAADFATRDLVQRIQKRPGPTLPARRCIAYLNVGQAEDYRTYWTADWRAPTADRAGSPPFLLGLDPDGWAGNYPVAYWDPAWRRCLFGNGDALLDQILDDGFDGAYLDWILGFDDPLVRAAAAAAGVDPARAMTELLRDLRAYAHARDPLFALIAQNGVALAERAPAMLQFVDALAQEDLSFRGLATARWFDAGAGDIPAPDDGDWSTARLAERLAAIRQQGLEVFTLDYALRPENIERALATSHAHGFVPCVSRTPLDRLPAKGDVRADALAEPAK